MDIICPSEHLCVHVFEPTHRSTRVCIPLAILVRALGNRHVLQAPATTQESSTWQARMSKVAVAGVETKTGAVNSGLRLRHPICRKKHAKRSMKHELWSFASERDDMD